MKIITLFLLFSLTISLSAYYTSNSYNLEENYSINFSTKKAEGYLTGLTGEVIFDEHNIQNSSMNVKVDVSTIKTGNKLKDKHARGSKWFDINKYPTINFLSESISKTKEGYQVTGTLKIKDVSQQHTIDFHVEKLENMNYLIGHTVVNRELFNIKGNSFGFLVGDDVRVDLRIPADYVAQP
jgi:polyisoprenoid-binding protein YceI